MATAASSVNLTCGGCAYSAYAVPMEPGRSESRMRSHGHPDRQEARRAPAKISASQDFFTASTARPRTGPAGEPRTWSGFGSRSTRRPPARAPFVSRRNDTDTTQTPPIYANELLNRLFPLPRLGQRGRSTSSGGDVLKHLRTRRVAEALATADDRRPGALHGPLVHGFALDPCGRCSTLARSFLVEPFRNHHRASLASARAFERLSPSPAPPPSPPPPTRRGHGERADSSGTSPMYVLEAPGLGDETVSTSRPPSRRRTRRPRVSPQSQRGAPANRSNNVVRFARQLDQPAGVSPPSECSPSDPTTGSTLRIVRANACTRAAGRAATHTHRPAPRSRSRPARVRLTITPCTARLRRRTRRRATTSSTVETATVEQLEDHGGGSAAGRSVAGLGPRGRVVLRERDAATPAPRRFSSSSTHPRVPAFALLGQVPLSPSSASPRRASASARSRSSSSARASRSRRPVSCAAPSP